jgi:hypothetical protein
VRSTGSASVVIGCRAVDLINRPSLHFLAVIWEQIWEQTSAKLPQISATRWVTQDRYMSRGRVHTQVADLLDRTVTGINDE